MEVYKMIRIPIRGALKKPEITSNGKNSIGLPCADVEIPTIPNNPEKGNKLTKTDISQIS
ncbi:MAG: hypothetical protein KAJ51_15800 [Thermoplasmata archaeon]|nr:hypothetical protein [Thermoplasmata archaeon]